METAKKGQLSPTDLSCQTMTTIYKLPIYFKALLIPNRSYTAQGLSFEPHPYL
jgi:hypothetical protein